MVLKTFLLGMMCLCAFQCRAKHIKASHGYLDSSLYDDIRLTATQQQEMKERGFLSPGKWPKVKGVVTIPYYFDPKFFPVGNPIREKFKVSAALFKEQTCVEWVEIPKEDPRHKVKIYQEGGCWSNLGMIAGPEQSLSLVDGCYLTGTMLHEMGHCVGLFHTQSRPDRDQYVKIWMDNVQLGKGQNFELGTGDTFDVPYDYKSMMHYGNNFFSSNGSFTLTTLDPYAMYAIGARPDNFRFSDVALINKGYDCIAEFTAQCGERNCRNGGFVGKDCKCRCPENTNGESCETIVGPFFSEKPKCGGDVTTPGEIIPNGYPASPTDDKCIFSIRAPNCKLPAITFLEAKFYWNTCDANMLSLQVSTTSYGYTWCKQYRVPKDKQIISETQNATLYYFSDSKGVANLGFRAKIQFVDDPKCGPVGPSSSTTKTSTITSTKTTTTTTFTSNKSTSTTSTTTTTKHTSTTTTTVIPSSACTVSETGSNTFEYQTNNFPSVVALGTTCTLTRSSPKNTDLIFSKLDVVFQGFGSDSFQLTDPGFGIEYQYSAKATLYALWPLTITFNAMTRKGKGFKVTATQVTGLPFPCNGEKIELLEGETRKIANPLFKTTIKNLHCACLISAAPGKKIAVKTLVNRIIGWETLRIAPYLPKYDYFVDINETMTSWSNLAKLYYVAFDTYSPWELQITSV